MARKKTQTQKTQTQSRTDAPARQPLDSKLGKLAPPCDLLPDEVEAIRHAAHRGDEREVESIIASARKRAGQTVTLDASEVERLRVVAETYNANADWNATPPSDVELHAMKSVIARVDGVKYAERNPHPRYICGVVVGSIARDARKREQQARRDAADAEFVFVRDLGTFHRRDVERVFARWDGKASIDTSSSGVTTDTNASNTTVTDEKSAQRVMVEKTEQAAHVSKPDTNTEDN